ncbi:MAG: amino acid adenylation domain-containing protein [Bacteroidales bacterium]|nr:amino acid adenylation domain-containing protein [Bacteroidales bacterium]
MEKQFPLSRSQYGLYVACLGHPGEVFYNLPFLYTLDGSLDADRLCRAVEAAAEAHPVLFTRISQGADGEPVQAVRKERLSLKAELIESIDTVKKDLIKPFDILSDRLFRIRIMKDASILYLFLDIHHIISDGVSMQVLVRDIGKAYDGEALSGEELSLADFAGEEAALRATPAYAEDKAWFAATYDCQDTFTEVCPDLEDTEKKDGRLGRILEVSPEEAGAFCRKAGMFKSTFYTAAYAFLLARYCGGDEALFNTVYAGRDDKRLAGSVGMFVKTIPVYARFDAGTSVMDFLGALQEQMGNARKHGLYSYSEAVHDLGLQSATDFGWHGEIFGDGSFAGKPMSSELIEETRISKLYFKAYILGGRIHVEAEYNANEYSQSLISSFLESYEEVVKGFLSKERLSEIGIASEGQIRLLDSFNAPEKPYDLSETVVSAFRRQAGLTPDKTLVVYKDRRYTFREVDRISENIAAHLLSRGLGREDVVSIIIPRCEWMIIAPLGVLKAGCTYQPLDPTYPEERLNFMVKDAGARYLIADRDLRHLVTGYDGETLLTDEIAGLGDGDASEVEVNAQDRMVLLYTSGSTGVPKGCEILHRNVVSFCRMSTEMLHMDSSSRLSAYASFGFDAHLMDVVCPVITGAEIHVIPEELRLDLMALNDYFNENGITHTFMTTQVAYQFATSEIPNTSLKYFLTGGEKLASLVPPKNFTLFNAYGPTETVCYVTAYPVTDYRKNIPIGKSVANCRCYIVDACGHRQSVGAAGELWISGPQVSRGYLGRPDKTAEVFVRNPFTDDPFYADAYRTGDIVRYLPDGNIQFVGRKDGMVKIRGFRIELKEVEAVIRKYPGIRDATVQAFDAKGGGKFIAAYIVADGKIDVEALNAFIMEEKPPYMVPAVTMQIDAIPLNQNQKVNRKALPEPVLQKEEGAGRSAPLNILEQEIVRMAGIEGEPDITTPLGFLGLTSISAIKLAVRLSKKYGVSLNAKEMVKTGTVQSVENEILASMLSGEAAPAAGPARQEAAASRTFALSAPQQGVYVDCLKNPASTIYNIPVSILLPEGTEPERVVSAVKAIVRAHPELTVSFGSEGSDIVQTTHPGIEVDVPVLKVSREEFASVKADFVKPFNLTQAPLCRFCVAEAGGEVYLLSDMHHLVSDGASYDIFFRQLCTLLEGGAIDPEQLDYAGFVSREKATDLVEAAGFFDSQLGGVEGVTELTSDLTNPFPDGRTESASAPVDWPAVEAFCRANGVTAAHLMLSSVIYTLSRFSANPDVTLVTISNGRSDTAIADTIGMFVNTLAIHARVTPEKVSDFVRGVSRTFDETLRHENYPFAKVAADYDLTAEIMFAYQIGVIDSYSVGGKALRTESLELDVPKFPIAFYINEIDGVPSVVVEYDNGKYSRAMMESLAASAATAAKRFAESPDALLTGISLLDGKRTEILDGFNDTSVEYDASETVVSLFRRRVAENPDKPAVVYEDKVLTYREVDEISERIAGKILSLGLVRESVVSVLIPRCEWMSVASLGVLKAGCAYQPLDPGYPKERLGFMIQDASARLLIADESLIGLVDGYKGPVLFTKDIAALPETRVPAEAAPRPQDLFILLYTSGSTGTPKGCQWEHRNIVAFCAWYRRKFSLGTDCRVSAYASYGFDACQMDMYSALTAGATSYIVPESLRLDLPALAAFYEREGVTHAFMTTQIAYQFATTQKCASLRYLLTGGEKLASLAPPGNYTLVNIYGPTECTICITTYDLKDTLRDIPIGKPTDNTKLYIVDSEGHRLPLGAAGELWAEGPQVSRGYLNRPEKTAETYIPNPFGPGIIYRTGDIVRYQGDGNIQFVGRRDGQVKIRGFRIELKEVEAVIREYPGIKDATVQAFDYSGGGKYIVAYIVSGSEVDVGRLNAFIAERKPSYMVPAATMQIDSIPLNQNQKVNRKALPAPVINVAQRHYDAPLGDTEKLFCKIFQDVLSMDKVGATDNFFDLGGTSLMVTRVIIEADKAGRHVAYGDIFDHPTPRLLAASLDKDGEAAAGEDRTVTGYDYSAIDRILGENTLDAFRSGGMLGMKNVLLTGATGYLGIHMLNELIHSDAATICCLVRGKGRDEAERRLKTLLYYYFESTFQELFDSGRLRVAVGDVTSDIGAAVGPLCEDAPVDTVFNCAAVVKHFSKGTEIEDVNVGGAAACVEFCLAHGARLIHVSTYSTAGLNTGDLDPSTVLTETKLYYGQSMENAYVHSKFLSERLVLEAAATRGLSAKVVRLGNLAPRSTDGEFQINFQTNSAMGRVRAYKVIGGYPYGATEQPMEFSPINEVARAIVLLSRTPEKCRLFHPYNNHSVFFGDVLDELRIIGDAPRQMEEEEFARRMEEAGADPDKAPLLTGVLAYADMAHGKKATMIMPDNRYTTQVLYRLGFRWSPTSWDYVDKFLLAISRLGYFKPRRGSCNGPRK